MTGVQTCALPICEGGSLQQHGAAQRPVPPHQLPQPHPQASLPHTLAEDPFPASPQHRQYCHPPPPLLYYSILFSFALLCFAHLLSPPSTLLSSLVLSSPLFSPLLFSRSPLVVSLCWLLCCGCNTGVLQQVSPLAQLRKASSVQSLERRAERSTILGELHVPYGLAPRSVCVCV